MTRFQNISNLASQRQKHSLLDGGTHYDGYFYTYRYEFNGSSWEDIITRYGYSHGGFESVNEINLFDEGLTYYNDWFRVLVRHDGKVLHITSETSGFPPEVDMAIHLFSENLVHENTLTFNFPNSSQGQETHYPILDENNSVYIPIEKNTGTPPTTYKILKIESNLVLQWTAFSESVTTGLMEPPFVIQSKVVWPSSTGEIYIVDKTSGSMDGKVYDADDEVGSDYDYSSGLEKRTWTILSDGKIAVLWYTGSPNNPTFYVTIFTTGFVRFKKINVSALGFDADIAAGNDQPIHLTRDSNDNLILYNGSEIITLDLDTEEFSKELSFNEIPNTDWPRYIWPLDTRNWVFFTQISDHDGVIAGNRNNGKTFMDGFFPSFTIDSVVAKSDNYELTELAGDADDISFVEAPTNFTAVVDSQDVDFSWDAVTGVDSYDVYIDDGTGFEKHNESPIGTNSYSIEGYSAGTYDAYVVAVKNGVESAPSNEDEFTIEGVGFASTYSLLLNGSNQYVDMGFTDSSLFKRFTVEVWFKTTSQSPMAIIGSGNSGFDELIQIILNRNLSSSTVSGKIVCFIRDEDENIFRFEITTAESSVYDGNWHHLAVVRDGNNSAKIYLDGVSKSLTSDVQNNPDSFGVFQNNLPLGANKYITNPFNLHFDGQLFEARFWSVSRTEQEIQNNRNQSIVPSTDFATDFPNLEIYYQMTDEAGNTISDATGNYDGTLNGNVGDNMWSEDTP